MILAIDIGNTNIVLGCVEGKKTYFIERLSTDKAKTELEYAVSLKNVLELYEIPVEQIEGGIISSVVPQVTELAWELKKAGVDLPDGILSREEFMNAILPLMKKRFPDQVNLEGYCPDVGTFGTESAVK